MKDPLASFDWNQARAFLATAETGSLSAAARRLDLTQPTLSRQVASLEQALGVQLFERVGRRLILTHAGSELLAPCQMMGQAADQLSIRATGHSQDVTGMVRLTSTNHFATHHLPKMIKEIMTLAPGLTLEIMPSNDVQDLMRREADIAIRHGQPEQPDLIAKRLGHTTAHLYAAPSYLDRFGRPRTKADLSRAAFIGMDHAERLLPHFQAMGLPLTVENFRLCSSSGTVMRELVRQGLGISVLSDDLAGPDPGLEVVLPDMEPFEIPIWLVTHRELHTARRIRVVFDVLAEAIQQAPFCQPTP